MSQHGIDPLWAKYGLRLQHPSRYPNLDALRNAGFAHFLVTNYLETHLDAQLAYFKQQKGYRYLDILAVAEGLYALHIESMQQAEEEVSPR